MRCCILFSIFFYGVGSSFWPREEEDEAERWQVLYADLSHCGSAEEITSYWPKYLCSWRPRSNCTGQKPIQHGRCSRGISKRRNIRLMKFFSIFPHSHFYSTAHSIIDCKYYAIYFPKRALWSGNAWSCFIINKAIYRIF